MTNQAAETLFLSTIPGATPSKWIHRYTARGSHVQLVTQDEQSQTLFLQPSDPPRYLPQLGYLRWRADQTWQDLVTGAGLDPRSAERRVGKEGRARQGTAHSEILCK